MVWWIEKWNSENIVAEIRIAKVFPLFFSPAKTIPRNNNSSKIATTSKKKEENKEQETVKAFIKALKKAMDSQSETIRTKDDAIKFISEFHIETQYEQVMKVLEEIINTSSNDIPKIEKDRIIKTIRSRQILKTLLSQKSSADQ